MQNEETEYWKDRLSKRELNNGTTSRLERRADEPDHCCGPTLECYVSSPDRQKTVPFLTYSLLLLCQQRYVLTEIHRTTSTMRRGTRSTETNTSRTMRIGKRPCAVSSPTQHPTRSVPHPTQASLSGGRSQGAPSCRAYASRTRLVPRSRSRP